MDSLIRRKENWRKWYESHKEEHKAKVIEWRKKNPEKCKEYSLKCNRKADRNWIKKKYQINKEKTKKYLLSHPCVDCGNKDVRVLEFDHVRGIKYKQVTNLLQGSWNKIFEEIEKCEVRCANCHKIKTDSERTLLIHNHKT